MFSNEYRFASGLNCELVHLVVTFCLRTNAEAGTIEIRIALQYPNVKIGNGGGDVKVNVKDVEYVKMQSEHPFSQENVHISGKHSLLLSTNANFIQIRNNLIPH